MAKKTDSLLISLVILVIAALMSGLVNSAKTSYSDEVDKPVFPLNLGEWNFFREIPLSEDVLNILGTRGAGLAEYSNKEGEKLSWYILKTGSRRASIHQPEYCYLGSGKNELLQRGTMTIDRDENNSFKVNYLIVQAKNGFQAVVYFYTANELISNNYYKQQFYFLLRRLKGEKIEGSLIRISKFYFHNDSSLELKNLQHIVPQVIKNLNLTK
ncbi:MAG: EpsI family protein [Candidatus Omnitrophica bacterium]|nr:EpsI family protein [Candidatus Omnitrophota bacterium]